MTEATLTTVSVTLEDRPDGGLRVFSDDLPGLILSGPDRKAVTNQIAPAIEGLFKFGHKKDVKVTPTRNLHAVLSEPSPRSLDMNCHTIVFVVELAAAA